MSKLVADIIVDTLQKAGVRHCYTLVVHFILRGNSTRMPNITDAFSGDLIDREGSQESLPRVPVWPVRWPTPRRSRRIKFIHNTFDK